MRRRKAGVETASTGGAGRRILVGAALWALAIPGHAAQGQQAGEPSAPDRQAIQQVLDAMVEAWNRDDLEGHVAGYADDATYTAGNAVLRGRKAIVGTLGGFRTPDGLYGDLRFEDVAMRALGGDHALVTGRYVLTAPGQPDRSGRFTLVMARTGAGWRAVHDHSS